MANWYGIQSALLAAIICGALAIHVLLGRRTNPIFGRFAAFNLNLVVWFLVDAMTLTEALGPSFAATARGLVAGLLPASCVTFFVVAVIPIQEKERYADQPGERPDSALPG